jgi:hypothetical protein
MNTEIDEMTGQWAGHMSLFAKDFQLLALLKVEMNFLGP